MSETAPCASESRTGFWKRRNDFVSGPLCRTQPNRKVASQPMVTRMLLFTRSRSPWRNVLFIVMLCMAPVPALAVGANCPNANIVKAAAASITRAAQVGTPDAFAAAISRHANITELAMSALGRYRQELPADIVRNMCAVPATSWAGHGEIARRIASAKLVLVGCSGNLVRSKAGGEQILWRVSGGRVRDISVGNVWLALSMQSKFTAVIRRGKSIDAPQLSCAAGNRVTAHDCVA